jgi:hypothetical protein
MAKSIFDESTLDDDLDEFLPKIGIGNRSGQPEPESTPVAAPAEAEEPALEVEGEAGLRAAERAPQLTATASHAIKPASTDIEGNPTAEISADNLTKLRNLNLAEKKKNLVKARTYGQIVLDAIDATHEDLAQRWIPAATAEKAPGSRFTRQPVIRKRRRHSAPPAKIALTGLNSADAKTIDEELVKEWGAPSRSALVDEALTLYFKRRRGPARPSEASVSQETGT